MIEIKSQSPPGEAIVALLKAHHEDMFKHSPPESVHALDVVAMQSSNLTFWGAWQEDVLAGCGALRELDDTHGEIKSMRTDARFLRQGIALKILRTMMVEAARRGYKRLSLETGSMSVFRPARLLYTAHGFEICGPFAEYSPDPSSVFMTKTL